MSEASFGGSEVTPTETFDVFTVGEGQNKNRAFALFSVTVLFRAFAGMRAADTLSALFLLLYNVKRRAENNKYNYRNYNYIRYHAFFLALTISAVIMPAKTATAHPPIIAGTTARDAGETMSVPTV